MKKPTTPKHLSSESGDWWERLTVEFQIDDEGGLLLLQTALEAFDRMRAAQEKVEQHGMIYHDRFNQAKPHPLLGVERDARGQMLAAFKQLNLDVEPLKSSPGRPMGS